MTRSRFLNLLSLSGAVFAASVFAGACVPLDYPGWVLEGASDPLIDAIPLDALNKQKIVGMGLGIVYQGEIVYLRGYGWADRTNSIEVQPTETMFRWASISKTVTGVLAGIGIQQGWVDLDRDIQTDLPDYPKKGVTLRHLLSHQAGVMHYSNGSLNPAPSVARRNDPKINTGIAWALSKWWDAPLISSPGAQFNYSTFGFNLAGAVLEKASGYHLKFAQLVDEFITIPSGLEDFQPDYRWQDIHNRSKGYKIKDIDDAQASDETDDSDVSWKLPGGGYISTPLDMARFCRAMMDDEVLNGAVRKQIWTRQKLSDGSSTRYGLGWFIGSRGGRRRVSHSGEQAKATAQLILYPDEDLCLILMTNTRGTGSASSLINLPGILNGIEDVIRARESNGEPVIQAEDAETSPASSALKY